MGGMGGGVDIMHDRSRMTIDHRIPTMPGRITSRFHRPGRHSLAPKLEAPYPTSRMKGEQHPTKKRL